MRTMDLLFRLRTHEDLWRIGVLRTLRLSVFEEIFYRLLLKIVYTSWRAERKTRKLKMNNKLIGLGLFVGGALIGSLITYLLIKDKYEKIAQQEIDEMGAIYYRKKREDVAKKYADLAGRYKADADSYQTKRPKGPDKRDYQDTDFHTCEEDDAEVEAEEILSHIYPGELAGEENMDNDPHAFENEQASKVYQQRDKGRAPYMIEESSFSEDNTCYDKLTVFYYRKDTTLADEGEEMFDDVRGTIGDEAMDVFEDEHCADVETVYVRNEKLGIDYEVIVLDKSYSEDILGDLDPSYAKFKERERRENGES